MGMCVYVLICVRACACLYAHVEGQRTTLDVVLQSTVYLVFEIGPNIGIKLNN